MKEVLTKTFKRGCLGGLIINAIFCFFAFVVNAQPIVPTISAAADKDTVNIGDVISYKVTVELHKDTEVESKHLGQNELGDFVVRKFRQTERKGKNAKKIITFHYDLVIFETGKHSIPEYTVHFRQPEAKQWSSAVAKSIEISVVSILGQEQNSDIKPIKPKIWIWQHYIFWLGLVLVIAGIILFFLHRYLGQRKKETLLPKPSAHAIAYRELEQLQQQNLIAKGRLKEYFEKLSGCLRRYLENRFNLRAPWMSTEEFLQVAKASSNLDAEQKTLLKKFLMLSDLVKFARYDSSVREADDSYIAAKDFIDQTKEPEVNKGYKSV